MEQLSIFEDGFYKPEGEFYSEYYNKEMKLVKVIIKEDISIGNSFIKIKGKIFSDDVDTLIRVINLFKNKVETEVEKKERKRLIEEEKNKIINKLTFERKEA